MWFVYEDIIKWLSIGSYKIMINDCQFRYIFETTIVMSNCLVWTVKKGEGRREGGFELYNRNKALNVGIILSNKLNARGQNWPAKVRRLLKPKLDWDTKRCRLALTSSRQSQWNYTGRKRHSEKSCLKVARVYDLVTVPD